MVIKVFIDYMSQPSRAVLAVCLLGKIPHEVIEVQIIKGEVKRLLFRPVQNSSEKWTRPEKFQQYKILRMAYSWPKVMLSWDIYVKSIHKTFSNGIPKMTLLRELKLMSIWISTILQQGDAHFWFLTLYLHPSWE